MSLLARLCRSEKGAVWIVAVLSAVAGAVLTEVVYRGATVTWDESSYLFQAHLFADGKIKLPAPPLPAELERGMIIQHPEQGWLSRYPFVHSLWLVPGIWCGVPRLMIWLAATLSIFGMGVLGTLLGVRRLVLPVMLATTAVFPAMHGTLLSHTSGICAVIGMLAFYVKWQTSRRWGFALVAGLLWAFYFNNRTFTAALIALPFGIDALAQLRPAHWRSYGAQILIFAGAAATGLVVFMIYNKLAVGDWMTSTYLFYNPTQNLGFGPRDGRMTHTLALGIQNTKDNLVSLDEWLYGFRYSLPLLVLLGIAGMTRRWTFLFAAACVSVVAGYVAFWYPGVRNAGPVYYFEMLPFLVAGAGIGLNRLLNRLPGALVLPVSMVLVIGVSICSIHHLEKERERQGPMQTLKRTVLDTTASAPENALVVFRDMGRHMIHECALNAKGMQSSPLILVERRHYWNDQFPVFAHFVPDREIFIIQGGREAELQKAVIAGGTDVMLTTARAHRKCGENIECENTGNVVRRHENGSPADMSFFGSYLRLTPGRYQAEFSVSLTDCDVNEPVIVDVRNRDAADTMARRHISGNLSNAMICVQFDVSEIARVEPRVYYGGSGTLVLRHVRVCDRAADGASVDRDPAPQLADPLSGRTL